MIGILHNKKIICPACGRTLTSANRVIDYGLCEDFQAFFFKRRCECKTPVVTFTNIGMTERYGVKKPSDLENGIKEDKELDVETAPEPDIPEEEEPLDSVDIVAEAGAVEADVVPDPEEPKKRKRRTKAELEEARKNGGK